MLFNLLGSAAVVEFYDDHEEITYHPYHFSSRREGEKACWGQKASRDSTSRPTFLEANQTHEILILIPASHSS